MTERQPPAYVVAHIQKAFAEEAGLGELGLQVAVRDDKIFVAGEVPTEERRDAVAKLLGKICPDYEIHNQVSLMEVSDAVRPERLA